MGYVIAGYLVTFLGLGAYAATLGQRVRRARRALASASASEAGPPAAR